MNKFIKGVELHGASSFDSEALHGFMAALKFRRTISADDGRDFILPTATYYSFGDLATEDVRALAATAATAANRTGPTSWVLVIDAKSLSNWSP